MQFLTMLLISHYHCHNHLPVMCIIQMVKAESALARSG